MTNLKNLIIRYIQYYRQGTKTIHEIKTELEAFHNLKDISENLELPIMLLNKIGLGPFNCEELFDLPNAVATRTGLLHLLKSYTNGDINEAEINYWAESQFVWEIGLEQNDPLVDSIVTELAFSEEYIKEHLSFEVIKRFVKILNAGKDEISENICFLLSFESTRQGLAYLLTEYQKGQKESLDRFLIKNFGVNFENFLFRPSLEKCSDNISENLILIDRLIN